jgi:hypothetical protein
MILLSEQKAVLTTKIRNSLQQTYKKVLAEYARAAEGTVVDGQKVFMDTSAYLNQRSHFMDIIVNQPAAKIDYYIPQKFETIAKRVVSTIDRNLSTSDAGKMLKKIAAPKNTFWIRLGRVFNDWNTP